MHQQIQSGVGAAGPTPTLESHNLINVTIEIMVRGPPREAIGTNRIGLLYNTLVKFLTGPSLIEFLGSAHAM